MLVLTSSQVSGQRLKRILRCNYKVGRRSAYRALKALKGMQLLVLDRIAWSWFSNLDQKRLLKQHTVLVICF